MCISRDKDQWMCISRDKDQECASVAIKISECASVAIKISECASVAIKIRNVQRLSIEISECASIAFTRSFYYRIIGNSITSWTSHYQCNDNIKNFCTLPSSRATIRHLESMLDGRFSEGKNKKQQHFCIVQINLVYNLSILTEVYNK